MTDTSPPAIRVDHDGDLWTPDGDRWACRTSPSQRPTLERLEFAHGPTVEYVPAARVAELETERDEARAHVLRVEAQRMDWQLIHDRLDALVAQLRALGHPVTGELTDAPAAAATTGGEADL